jgi:hypothetical protein
MDWDKSKDKHRSFQDCQVAASGATRRAESRPRNNAPCGPIARAARRSHGRPTAWECMRPGGFVSAIIENRVGAGGNVGTEAVVRAPPDGYTLLQVSSANAWNATLYDKLNFNFIRDIAPVASIYLAPGVLGGAPSFPAKSVPELIAYHGQSGQDQYGVWRCWERAACLRRVVQGNGWRRHGPRSLSWRRASGC